MMLLLALSQHLPWFAAAEPPLGEPAAAGELLVLGAVVDWAMATLTPAASSAAEVSALSLPSFIRISSARWSVGDVANEGQRVEHTNVPVAPYRRARLRCSGFRREAAARTPQSDQQPRQIQSFLSSSRSRCICRRPSSVAMLCESAGMSEARG
jgi:hypothetical protein